VKPGSILKDSGSESLERAEHLECDVRVRTAVARKKAGTLGSGLFDHGMVAGVRFELTTFGLCDLTQLSLRVGLSLHPV
jgi:hypothetical protein